MDNSCIIQRAIMRVYIDNCCGYRVIIERDYYDYEALIMGGSANTSMTIRLQ